MDNDDLFRSENNENGASETENTDSREQTFFFGGSENVNSADNFFTGDSGEDARKGEADENTESADVSDGDSVCDNAEGADTGDSVDNGAQEHSAAFDGHSDSAGIPLYPYSAAGTQNPVKPGKARKSKKTENLEKRRRIAGFAAMLAVCVVLSSVTGSLSSLFVMKRMTAKNTEESLSSSENETLAQIPPAQDETQTQTPETQTQAETSSALNTSSSTYTTGEIYAQAVNSIVIVTSTYNTTVQSFFGQSYSQTATSTGSGFFVSADGYIVTNYHVVENGENFKVTTYSGDEYTASLVGYEASNDIAVLKISGVSVTPVTLGNSSALAVGDDIMVIGNALGELSFTLTNGVVSYLNRSISTESGTAINMFQTNAAINEGNSGGPVYNMHGEVVGVASAKYASSSIEGLGFCIPIDDVRDMISDIISYGYVTGKASLGVSLQTISSSMSMRYSVPTGCYVVAVGSGSAADKAGIKEADVITYVGTERIESCEALASALSALSSGDTVNITVSRDGDTQNFSLTLDEYKPASARTTYSNVYDY